MVVLFISQVVLLRDALVAILQQGDEHQAYSAFSRETVEAAVAASAPTVVVVDALHPEATVLVATVRARLPKVRVVVLAMQDRDEDFLAWADIGISGYLGADASARDITSTVRRVNAGEVACPPRLTAVLLSRFSDYSNTRQARAGIFALTTREREVAELLASGMSNKLIARQLHVALPTVKNHVHNILDKWEVRSRGEAAARYREKIGEENRPMGGKVVEVRATHVSPIGSSAMQSGMLRNAMPSQSSRRAA